MKDNANENLDTLGVDEIIDLEEFSKKDKEPPRKRRYRIKIDREKYVVDVECLTGREILELAGKKPAEQFQLRQKFRKGHVEKIGLDEKVDFTRRGIEKFVTIPLDQTEG